MSILFLHLAPIGHDWHENTLGFACAGETCVFACERGEVSVCIYTRGTCNLSSYMGELLVLDFEIQGVLLVQYFFSDVNGATYLNIGHISIFTYKTVQNSKPELMRWSCPWTCEVGRFWEHFFNYCYRIHCRFTHLAVIGIIKAIVTGQRYRAITCATIRTDLRVFVWGGSEKRARGERVCWGVFVGVDTCVISFLPHA